MDAIITLCGILGASFIVFWVSAWVWMLLLSVFWPDGELGILAVGGWAGIATGVIFFLITFAHYF